MRTDCNQQGFEFSDLISRSVQAQFDNHHVSSDAGGLLLGQLDRSFGFTKRVATNFRDRRDRRFIEHDLLNMIRQRIYGIALGYEDINDHDTLRADPLLATLCGQNYPEGKERRNPEDKGKPLAGKSTLNRLELKARKSKDAKYKKIEADFTSLEDFFIREYVRMVKKDTREVVLELDNTDDPLHGNQEGRFFHGYYDQYCYTPLYIFAGHWLVAAQLRTGQRRSGWMSRSHQHPLSLDQSIAALVFNVGLHPRSSASIDGSGRERVGQGQRHNNPAKALQNRRRHQG